MGTCAHLDDIKPDIPGNTKGCEECEKEHGTWVALRICLKCGHVGCCDSSPSRHATRHFQKSGHAVMASFPDRKWKWCYIDNDYV